MSLVRLYARRFIITGTSSLMLFTIYKSKTDPVHFFWDLDQTLLCSISPIPNDTTNNNNIDNNKEDGMRRRMVSNLLPRPPKLQYFDQIDDDFPYDVQTLSPNTRTYIRPGAMLALYATSILGVVHVFTAAQQTYTNNILHTLNIRNMFRMVIHRDDYPEIVRIGKDLNVVGGMTTNMKRAILFDDRVSNFKPQKYANGIAVVPFTSNNVGDIQNHGYWGVYSSEIVEMCRLVGIALWCTVHLSGDVRNVVEYVRRWKKEDTPPP